jgi:mono/diheme cytochrome c family protein
MGMLVAGVVVLVGLGAAAGIGAAMFGLIPGVRSASRDRLPPGDHAADASDASDASGAAATADGDASPVSDPVSSAGMDDVPVLPATAAGETVVSEADSADGEMVFRGVGRCASCHGTAGEGVARLGPSLRDAQWIAGDGSVASIERVVREGVAPPREFPVVMPAFAGQLSAQELSSVAKYVHTLSHPGAIRRDSLPADTTLPPR